MENLPLVIWLLGYDLLCFFTDKFRFGTYANMVAHCREHPFRSLFGFVLRLTLLLSVARLLYRG